MKQWVTSSLVLAALLLPLAAWGQTVVDGGASFRARAAVSADYKITKGLHINLEEEVRLGDGLGSLSRLQTTLGVDYKINSYLKMGASYGLLENYKATKKVFSPRHRGRFYLKGTLPLGPWRLSLKETLQLTHRPGEINATQAPRNALALKSRLQLSYKGWKPLEPYAFFELRTGLNEAAVQATYNTATLSWSGYSFGGYGVVHNDRYRAGLGLDWKLSKHHSLSLYSLLDWNRERSIDTKLDENDNYYLSSFTLDKSFVSSIGLSYKFSF